MSDVYLKLLEYVEDDCKLNIPEEWGLIVLECVECLEAIC